MIDVNALWDWGDPAGSEARFLEALDDAEGADIGLLQTQIARALGLQGAFDEALALLSEIESNDPEVKARIKLEEGRVLRSSGDPDAARPCFESAADKAAAAGLDALQVDALHMRALVAPADRQIGINEQALRIARSSKDPRARDWDASLLNNIGMSHADAGDFAAALTAFEEALAARVRIGDDARTRVARWMVGWALRNLDRRDEALAIQQALKAELDAIGESDPYVDEELELLEP